MLKEVLFWSLPHIDLFKQYTDFCQFLKACGCNIAFANPEV